MVQENENLVPSTGAAANAAASTASSNLKDTTKIKVKALVPAVYYTCPQTYESFAWLEVGEVQEMTYKQIRIMKSKHPRYFTEKWLRPCNDAALVKLNLESVFKNSFTTGDMKYLYDSDISGARERLSGLSDEVKAELIPKVKEAIKNGRIANVKMIRLLEQQLGVELMQLV